MSRIRASNDAGRSPPGAAGHPKYQWSPEISGALTGWRALLASDVAGFDAADEGADVHHCGTYARRHAGAWRLDALSRAEDLAEISRLASLLTIEPMACD